MSYNINKFFISLFLFFPFYIGALDKLPRELAYAQEMLIKAFVESGYGDVEVDDLHKKIESMLPLLNEEMKIVSDTNKVVLNVGSGESFRVSGERYIFTGVAEIYKTGNKLDKIVLIYERLNANSDYYKMEKRILTNSTPLYVDGSVDKNDDLMIAYEEKTSVNGDYKPVSEYNFPNIDMHEFKMQLFNSYKQYLRKTAASLDESIQSYNTRKRFNIIKIAEFQ